MENKKLPITFVMVIYNEEKLLERALLSCFDLADEIIVVHDGECSDRSLDIARKYTDKVIVRPHAGHAEAHRCFTYESAKNDWIFQLDADEYLSDGLRNNLNKLIEGGADIYDLYWPMIKNNRNHLAYYKNALFRKSKVYYIGSLHQYVRPINETVVTKKSDYQLCHLPDYDNLSWKVFKTKWVRWAKLQAKEYNGEFSALPKWNYDKDSWDYPTNNRIKHPIFFGMILTPLYHFGKGLMDCFKGKSLYLFKNELFIGLYFFLVFYFYVYYFFIKFKKTIRND